MIRDYTEQDRKAVLEHLVAFQEHERLREPTYLPGNVIAESYLNDLLSECGWGNGKMMVAEHDGKVVGYSCFYLTDSSCQTFSKQVEVSDIYLAPECRGKGFGRLFLEAAEAFGRERGAYQLTLMVLARNTEGRAMYHKCGFREFNIAMVKPI